MRLKYFFRGLGTGIVGSTIVLMIIFPGSGGKELTDAQILQKASEIKESRESGTIRDDKESLNNTQTTEKTTEKASEKAIKKSKNKANKQSDNKN
ncbi:hypothetical protein SAMN04487761_10193 [Lachnospiraceae bacterium C7]|nr:hypothetical protein SAMN04487761_10193 [Lachnospiraceae bacterium C7]